MTPEEILDICIEELEEHRETREEPYYWNKDNKTFTFLDHEAELISDRQLRTEMLKIIKTQLKTQGRIFLYTCQDNALITFEDIDPDETEEDLSCFQKQADNFYIGYD